jgi:ATP-binding cassette subfamily F protein uup
VKEYVGGYDDWLRQRSTPSKGTDRGRTVEGMAVKATPAPGKKRKLSFKEKKELDELPGKIERWETDIAALHEQMAAPAFYQQPREKIAAEQARLETLGQQLANAFARWEELEQLAE